MRRLCPQSETGTSLVEVLIALLILVSCALPITKFRAYILAGGPSGKELAHIIAVATMEEVGDWFYRTGDKWPPHEEDQTDYPALGHYFRRTWTVSPVTDNGLGTGKTMLGRVTVTVRCTDCVGNNPTVEVVALLAKIP